jgi:hypothetical protein
VGHQQTVDVHYLRQAFSVLEGSIVELIKLCSRFGVKEVPPGKLPLMNELRGFRSPAQRQRPITLRSGTPGTYSGSVTLTWTGGSVTVSSEIEVSVCPLVRYFM